MKPDLKLNGLGAHNSEMPFAVLSVYNGHSYLEKKDLKRNLLIDLKCYLPEEEEGQHIQAIQIPRYRLAASPVQPAVRPDSQYVGARSD